MGAERVHLPSAQDVLARGVGETDWLRPGPVRGSARTNPALWDWEVLRDKLALFPEVPGRQQHCLPPSALPSLPAPSQRTSCSWTKMCPTRGSSSSTSASPTKSKQGTSSRTSLAPRSSWVRPGVGLGGYWRTSSWHGVRQAHWPQVSLPGPGAGHGDSRPGVGAVTVPAFPAESRPCLSGLCPLVPP